MGPFRRCQQIVMEKSKSRLEDLKAGALVKGLGSDGTAKIVSVEWYGNQAVRVVFEDSSGQIRNQLLYRTDEARLDIAAQGRVWSFEADGELFRLASEAQRIRLAYLFDPYLAVHTSVVEPLPHQITAVYAEMLPRQPLRFLLADDPGAGKTIMAGLLIKELIVRGDLERCLIVAPGNLVEQWQDELYSKFALQFSILTRDQVEAARSGNPFDENSLLIARLDMMSRNEDLQQRFKASPGWDLVVVDEAHKMSASLFGGEVKYTKRYNLGRELGGHSRHLLLMSATPHNGKEADFQLFMALLDSDRFEGKYRDGAHKVDPSDLMRRLIKEDLYRFDGRRLFPERFSYTVSYLLSDPEATLYYDVTEYVRNEMNRADRLGEEQRRVNIGFALQILQRRLASSPEAIYQSIIRRRERLEKRLREEQLLKRGGETSLSIEETMPRITPDVMEELDDFPEDEVEQIEEEFVDKATASRTIAELELEIQTLKQLEIQAKAVRASGVDTKWVELSSILDDPLVKDANGNRRKLVIFTEFRDTLTYLAQRIRNLLGKPEAVVVVHGGVGREERRKLIEAFRQDKDVLVMLANDAVGEGVNLQRAHLMVNYDLPWNPNRLEQRFGRIHRIGQEEVCHLWNLVASETREGEVYYTLLKKLEREREGLGGKVYDVLGKLFQEKSLRELLMDAIRYGDDPTIKQKLQECIANAVDREHLIDLFEERALARDSMDSMQVQKIREDMERANARRLQPHFIRSFFLEAFSRLGGQFSTRESGRLEVHRVPAVIRDRDRQIGIGEPVLPKYERICFEKDKINISPAAAFVCPGHPLLDCTTDLILERYRELLKLGTVLIDENDAGLESRVLFYLQHSIQDGRTNRHGQQQIISERLQFVEVTENGKLTDAGPAPYLDYRPVRDSEWNAIRDYIHSSDWLRSDFEAAVLDFAITTLVPSHVEEVRALRLPLIEKVRKEVTSRLRKEINYWDHRAEVLREEERAGKKPSKLNSSNAAQKAEELADRLERRLKDLDRESEISALPPGIKGGAVIIPNGLLQQLVGAAPSVEKEGIYSRDEVDHMAMDMVMRTEQGLGREPRDVSKQRGIGYDIESKEEPSGSLQFIEVKGKWYQNDDVTLTKNEILCSRNEPEKFCLAIVVIDENGARSPRYVRRYAFGEPDFAETRRTFSMKKMLDAAEDPN